MLSLIDFVIRFVIALYRNLDLTHWKRTKMVGILQATFKYVLLRGDVCAILQFVPKYSADDRSSLVQVIAWPSGLATTWINNSNFNDAYMYHHA